LKIDPLIVPTKKGRDNKNQKMMIDEKMN